MSELDRMWEPEQVAHAIAGRTPVLPPETVSLAQAAGRVLATEVLCPALMPPFDASTMDGYAVRAGDVDHGRSLVGSQWAGAPQQITLGAGQCSYITTGAPLPGGADAVIPVERTAAAGDRVSMQAEPAAGDNIRPAGSDLAAGAVAVPQGTPLSPAAIGMLGSVGQLQVEVHRRPRVAVLSTGDEIVAPDQTPGPGQIRDSNRLALLAAVAEAGAEVGYQAMIADEEDTLRQVLTQQLGRCDVVITSGGVSMGERDLIKKLLPELAEVHLRQVRMRPGKPFTFATTAAGSMLFGLPGNPVSSLVGFEIFVRPALLSMQGYPQPHRERLRVRLSHAMQPVGRIDYQRVSLRRAADGVLEATAAGSQRSSRLASLVGADALVIVPDGDADFPAGSELTAVLLRPSDISGLW